MKVLFSHYFKSYAYANINMVSLWCSVGAREKRKKLVSVFICLIFVSAIAVYVNKLLVHQSINTYSEGYITTLRRLLTLQRQDVQSKRKLLFVIGILSQPSNLCFREAQRKMFIPRAKAYTGLNIKVVFLLDDRTKELNEEQRINGDIVFLNTTTGGWNRGFAKKLHMWLKFVVSKYPDAVLVGRMDDDVFVCTPQIFDRLNEVKHDLLYYGYTTGPRQDSVDEMFLILGKELVHRVAKRSFCSVNKTGNCLRDGQNGGHMFTKWIKMYDDIQLVDERPNKRMLWFFRLNEHLEKTYRHYKTINFCERFLLYHKASIADIYQMNLNNSLYLNESSLTSFSEKELNVAIHCLKYEEKR